MFCEEVIYSWFGVVLWFCNPCNYMGYYGKYTVRILCQLFIPSMYAISIALPVAVIVDLPFRILLYKKARRKAMVSNE